MSWAEVQNLKDHNSGMYVRPTISSLSTREATSGSIYNRLSGSNTTIYTGFGLGELIKDNILYYAYLCSSNYDNQTYLFVDAYYLKNGVIDTSKTPTNKCKFLADKWTDYTFNSNVSFNLVKNDKIYAIFYNATAQKWVYFIIDFEDVKNIKLTSDYIDSVNIPSSRYYYMSNIGKIDDEWKISYMNKDSKIVIATLDIETMTFSKEKVVYIDYAIALTTYGYPIIIKNKLYVISSRSDTIPSYIYNSNTESFESIGVLPFFQMYSYATSQFVALALSPTEDSITVSYAYNHSGSTVTKWTYMMTTEYFLGIEQDGIFYSINENSMFPYLGIFSTSASNAFIVMSQQAYAKSSYTGVNIRVKSIDTSKRVVVASVLPQNKKITFGVPTGAAPNKFSFSDNCVLNDKGIIEVIKNGYTIVEAGYSGFDSSYIDELNETNVLIY